MTVDEELTHLDSLLRRLKIEYEVFFNNPTKRPPNDLEWKVLALLRKHSDGGRMSFSQRFRYNEMAQRYAIYSDLWRKKSRIREEGYRRPQDALLSVQGVRVPEEHAAAASSRLWRGRSGVRTSFVYGRVFRRERRKRAGRAALQRSGRRQEEIG